MSEAKTAHELAEEYAHKLTRDRSVFDGNDERIAIVAFKAGHAAGLEVAEGLVKACEELSKADDRRETLGIYVVRIEAALTAFRKAGKC